MMKVMAKKPVETGHSVAEVATVGMVIGTIGDTTWRMCVPTVGLTLLGVWCDSVWQTKPWCMLAGIALGSGSAVVLVRRQLAAAKARSSAAPARQNTGHTKEVTQ